MLKERAPAKLDELKTAQERIDAARKLLDDAHENYDNVKERLEDELEAHGLKTKDQEEVHKQHTMVLPPYVPYVRYKRYTRGNITNTSRYDQDSITLII